jgi:hypothetical protein
MAIPLFCSVPTVMDRLQCNVNVHNVMDRIFGKNQTHHEEDLRGAMLLNTCDFQKTTHSMGLLIAMGLCSRMVSNHNSHGGTHKNGQ